MCHCITQSLLAQGWINGTPTCLTTCRSLFPFSFHIVQSFAEDAFYAWTYDRPSSPWMLVFTILGMAGVLAACLFPLAPYGIKVTVFYLASGLLTVILGTLVLRLFVAATSWILTGKTLWLLPNVLSEVGGCGRLAVGVDREESHTRSILCRRALCTLMYRLGGFWRVPSWSAHSCLCPPLA